MSFWMFTRKQSELYKALNINILTMLPLQHRWRTMLNINYYSSQGMLKKKNFLYILFK